MNLNFFYNKKGISFFKGLQRGTLILGLARSRNAKMFRQGFSTSTHVCTDPTTFITRLQKRSVHIKFGLNFLQ